MKKDSFVIYTEKEVFLRHLNDSQKARILEAFFAYADERELPEMDNVTSIIWEVFSLDFDRNNERYERTKKARSEAGRRHRGNQYDQNKTEQMEQTEQTEQNGTNGTKWNKMEQNGTKWNKMEQNGTNGTNGTDNVNVNVNVNDNVNDNVSLFNERIEDASADRERIFDYVFFEFFKNNIKNPEKEANKLIDYYSSQDWRKSGGQKITDLGAVCRIWKTEDSAVRFAPEINEFIRRILTFAKNEKIRQDLAKSLKDIQLRGENCVIICKKYLSDFIEDQIDNIKPIYQEYIGDKKLNYKIIKRL